MRWLEIDNAEDNGSTRAAIVRDTKARGTWVWHAGATFFLADTKPEQSRQGNTPKDNDVAAPLTGKLLELFVEVGDVVEAGSVVAVMEAMKMEYRLQVAVAGTVQTVGAAVGDLVDKGTIVVSIDDADTKVVDGNESHVAAAEPPTTP